jgi:hypothetical protein
MWGDRESAVYYYPAGRRNFKRLYKFDKTHDWRCINMAWNIYNFSLKASYYECVKCGCLKSKLYSCDNDKYINNYEIVYDTPMENNCYSCNNTVAKGIIE